GMAGISRRGGGVPAPLFCVHLIRETLRRPPGGEKNRAYRINFEIAPQPRGFADAVDRVLAEKERAAKVNEP
ncbi:hypothetical protein QMO35_28610, partial [Pseudomonas aeruginosa]|nr:hypothetical protein [Pseudomonas aeruginosa]